MMASLHASGFASGLSRTGGGGLLALVAAFAAMLLPPPAGATTYTAVDLTPSGYTDAGAGAIDGGQQVV